MTRRFFVRSMLALLLVAVAIQAVAFAGLPVWSARTTPASSTELRDLTLSISSLFLEQTVAYPVSDLHWKDEGIDLHLISGSIYQEVAEGDRPAGAYFVGQGTMTLDTKDPAAFEAVAHWFGSEIRDEPIAHAYILPLGGRTVAEILGIEGTDAVGSLDVTSYERYKRALRHGGLRVLQSYLNRMGRAEGGSFVLVSPPGFVQASSPDLTLMYSHDLYSPLDVRLDAIGHKALSNNPDYRGYFYPIVRLASGTRPYVPQADVSRYAIRVDLTKSMNDVGLVTRVEFVPAASLRALMLDMGPLLEVSSIKTADGTALPFLQWRYDDDDPNVDLHVLVDVGETLAEGEPHTLTVEARGDLFTAAGSVWGLRDEDTWFPQIDDLDGALFELEARLPKRLTAVSAGELVRDETEGSTRSMLFRTARPHRRTTFYVGDYRERTGKADDTKITVYMDELTTSDSDHRFTVKEVENIIKIFNRILDAPVEIDELRVASTPTSHGRGFEGLLLLSQGYGFRSDLSGADVFRAHEVAHQWFGNMVDVEAWPRDRWIMESLAEYVAMEYYRIRFENPKKTRTQIYENWIKPMTEEAPVVQFDLRGGSEKRMPTASRALSAGGSCVYSKGPWMMNTLRYLYTASKGSDSEFWTLLQDFIGAYSHDRASTSDFFEMAEQSLGMKLDWFVNQWIYGTAIPEIRWSHEVKQEGGKWVVSVNASTDMQDYFLVVPVYVHLKGGQTAVKPVVLKGGSGQAAISVPSQPKKVILNEFHDTIAVVSK